MVLLLFVGVTRGNYPGATWDGEHTYFDGYEWKVLPVYDTLADGDIKYGSSFGLPRRVFIGGRWDRSSLCGSRCMSCSHFSSRIAATRGCKEGNPFLTNQHINTA